MKTPPPFLHLLGVRHHGPGSARSLVERLAEIEPDCILIEGPADANPLIEWLGHDEMEPPVALLLYRTDEPNKASFFPYAQFSPEYQAIMYGLDRGLTVRFMDLPQKNMMAADAKPKMPDMPVFQQMALAAGFGQYEYWWHTMFEQRQENTAVFQAIYELMSHMRQQSEADAPTEQPEPVQKSQRVADQREAYMRTAIRQARNEGHQSIAVVCGAWHAPALADLENC